MKAQTGVAAAVKVAKSPNLVRTTVVIPDALDQNLAAWCLVSGQTKSEALKRALTEFLLKEGLQPDQKPQITYR
jgi:hypothetical protein